MNTIFNIRLGELKNEIEYECGVFDEIATHMLDMLFSNEKLLDKSSKSQLIMLPHSVQLGDGYYIDGIFVNNLNEYALSCSNKRGDDIFSLMPYEIEREYLVKILSEFSEVA